MAVERRPNGIGVVYLSKEQADLLLYVIEAAKWSSAVQLMLGSNKKIGYDGVEKLALLPRLDLDWYGELMFFVGQRSNHTYFELDKLLLDEHPLDEDRVFKPNQLVSEHLMSDQTACWCDVIEAALMIQRHEITKVALLQSSAISPAMA